MDYIAGIWAWRRANPPKTRPSCSGVVFVPLAVMLAMSGCGFGAAVGGKPKIERHEYPHDGVVCYLANGYGPRNYEVSMSCVKTKETP
jgi:hypothetical protein